MRTPRNPATRTEGERTRTTKRGHLAGAVAIAVILFASAAFGAFGLGTAHAQSALQFSVARSSAGGVPGAPTLPFGNIHHNTSSDWAGYVDVAARGNLVTEVSAAWYIPLTTCGEPNALGPAYDIQWVGIDGYGNGNLSRVGTAGYCTSHGATPTYYLWWEFYPYANAQLVYTATPGDPIQATVLYNPSWCLGNACGIYTLDLVDLSSGNSINVVGGGWVCSGTNCEGGPAHTAECISEQPSGYQLAKFSPVVFDDCTATIGTGFHGIGGFSNSVATTYALTQLGPISLLKSQTVSTLSGAVYKKSVFTVTWHHFD